MTPDSEIAAPPSRTFFGAFSDAESMAQAIGGIDPRSSPRAIGRAGRPFHATMARAALDQVNVGVGRFAEGVRQSADIPSDVHTFMFATEPGIVRRVSGRTLGGAQLIRVRPGDQTVTSSPPGMAWAFGIVTVSFDTLAALGPAMTGRKGVPLDGDRMFLTPEPAMTRLIGLMNDTARIAKDTPWIVEQPEPAAALAGAITDALLTCVAEGEMRRDRAALGRHRQIVARFEQVLRERPEEMLSLSAICAAVGVAQRTLNLACQEFLGQGAVAYARARRLDLVRHRLLASSPAGTQVTAVAMEYGFWELGRFALAYRLRFGERPQETLRRAA